MKIDVLKIFNKISSELNNREAQLISKIDEKFDNLFVKEKDIKLYEKIPKQIQNVLNEINSINKEWEIENLIII